MNKTKNFLGLTKDGQLPCPGQFLYLEQPVKFLSPGLYRFHGKLGISLRLSVGRFHFLTKSAELSDFLLIPNRKIWSKKEREEERFFCYYNNWAKQNGL